MPNITYDQSGSMISTLEDGTVNVYNPGDIAWVLTSTALGEFVGWQRLSASSEAVAEASLPNIEWDAD